MYFHDGKRMINMPHLFPQNGLGFSGGPGRDIFSVPLFELRIYLLFFFFHFENLSKYIIF